MAYSNFTMSQIEDQFGVNVEQAIDLCASIESIEISPFLKETLEENVPLALAIGTEKARSEFIVAPMLVELRKSLNHRIALFSGIDFNVDAEQGLVGICDFLITKSPKQLTIHAPVFVMVEAKKDDIKAGQARCLAEMIAAEIFNERRAQPIEPIYGCVTTGSLWNFIQLERNTAQVDSNEYSINDPNKIMGILMSMVSGN